MLRHASRVVCGVSGGVDSAVAALLLKRKGYDVIGLFMRNWDLGDENGRCTADAECEDARYVCDHLHIPFHEVNFVKEYWNTVFSYLMDEYQAGFTPNPDVYCNKYIKFDVFHEHAVNMFNADAIATGHYAKTSAGESLERVNDAEGVKLLVPKDSWKDQTLFLSQISQHALRRSVFPLGDLMKDEVRKLAVDAGMERIAKKKESFGICFIGSRNFQQFIEQYIEPRPGLFIDIDTNKVVAEHKGLHYWTVGQRSHIGGLSKAYFIAEKDAETQNIYLASGTDHPALFTETFYTDTPHWICSPPTGLSNQSDITLDFRFQHIFKTEKCVVCRTDCGLMGRLLRPSRAITPGQFAVFYEGEVCLGSAKIIKLGPSLMQQKLDKEASLLTMM